ncbi:NAD(P)H-dependent oxidoreductase [Telmatobacter sp. DSM 110680]|uniref:NAD(P)H-dependent oxidoreductase n=1 Tax=Telmatobacter sp. DSM 110680 TaxID=3036704 RepID=A0AAU7DF78_9BACT
MVEEIIKIGLVFGSTRPGRFCDTVARWAAGQVCAREGFTIESIDPAAPESNSDPSILKKRVAACDAFIIITPEYNHGYPAPLKALIDSFGQEWHAKPVAFVSYGGISGGIRAVEQLRLVFAELHAVTIRDTVSFASAWEQFDSNGLLRNPERAERSMDAMLRRLHWWAVSLAHARTIWPYAKTA